ncbi:TPA: ribonuclease domain-containing protein [Stenotrophomonas maltophilia]
MVSQGNQYQGRQHGGAGSRWKLYLETGNGLQPKAGGYLAGLVEAGKIIAAGKEPTRFIDGVTVVDKKAGNVLQGAVDSAPTPDWIKSGGSYPHKSDGSIFQNRAGDFPIKPAGYYAEYVHPTPGVTGRGANRMVVGKGGEMYCAADHYKASIPTNK